MSVWELARTPALKASTLCMKARFCSLATEGRSSKFTLARMSFSLKLPLSMRATARESPAVMVPSR